jgi:hypothetical protein
MVRLVILKNPILALDSRTVNMIPEPGRIALLWTRLASMLLAIFRYPAIYVFAGIAHLYLISDPKLLTNQGDLIPY